MSRLAHPSARVQYRILRWNFWKRRTLQIFSNNSAHGTKQSRCRSAILSRLRSPGCFILYYAYEFFIVYFRDHFQISMSMCTWATCVYANVHTYRDRFGFFLWVFLISLFCFTCRHHECIHYILELEVAFCIGLVSWRLHVANLHALVEAQFTISRKKGGRSDYFNHPIDRANITSLSC